MSRTDADPDHRGRESTSSQLYGSALLQDLQPVRAHADNVPRNPSVSQHDTPEFYVTLDGSDEARTSSVLYDGRLCGYEARDLLEYSWIVQHHSASSYPDCWSQPIKLLVEFSQTEDYKSRFAACVSGASSEDVPSHIDSNSTDRVVRSRLPASMGLKCTAPHLHRWNPSMSADFTDYFHERIKVLSTGGTLYR